jgi:DnaJ-class molecular chaperone
MVLGGRKMTLQEAYEELGLNYYNDKYLSVKKVETIYKKLVKQYHPDKNIDVPDYLQKLAEEKLQKINQAMEIIQIELKQNEEKIRKECEKGINYYNQKNYLEAFKYFKKNRRTRRL